MADADEQQSAKKPPSPKFVRCEEECIKVLRSTYPRFLGHRKVAIMMADPTRGETFCDELVRRALNSLVEQGRIILRTTRYQGMSMRLFGFS